MTDPLPLPPSRRIGLGLEGDLAQAQRIAAAIEEENALLLRQRADFRDRCVRAQETLTEIARTCRGDSQRVEGKVQGIGLALSYLDEYVRGVA